MASRFIWLPIGAALVWSVVSHQWYVCHIKQACGTPDTAAQAADTVSATAELVATAVPAATPMPDDRPLIFQWNTPTALTRASFADYRDTLIKSLNPGQLLEITGLYFPGESAPAGFADMGLARAAQIRALFVPPLSAQQIVETSRLVDTAPVEPGSTDAFVAAAFEVRTPEVAAAPVAEPPSAGNRPAILFPSASSVAEIDPAAATYLDELAKRLQRADVSATLVGHADGRGGQQINEPLALRRAKHVRDLLVARGVDPARLHVRSEGTASPVASNDTEEGRQQNRRVEIELIADGGAD